MCFYFYFSKLSSESPCMFLQCKLAAAWLPSWNAFTVLASVSFWLVDSLVSEYQIFLLLDLLPHFDGFLGKVQEGNFFETVYVWECLLFVHPTWLIVWLGMWVWVGNVFLEFWRHCSVAFLLSRLLLSPMPFLSPDPLLLTPSPSLHPLASGNF